jgi:hypothetical protein
MYVGTFFNEISSFLGKKNRKIHHSANKIFGNMKAIFSANKNSGNRFSAI